MIARAALWLALPLCGSGCALLGYDFPDVELVPAPVDAGADVRGDASPDCAGCESGTCGDAGKNRCAAVSPDL